MVDTAKNRKISGCIIAYNEEDNIAGCIENLNFCDEVVIIDSFSTDNTALTVKKIQTKFRKKNGPNIRFIKQKFLGYGPQKNFATSKCKYDWVLSLDADERVSDELKESLMQWKKNGGDFAAYETNRRNYYIDSWIYHCGWYPDRRIRFYHKQKGSWDDVQVHELYKLKEGKCGTLKGDLLHYSILSLDAHMDNINRFTTAAAAQLQARGKKSGPLRAVLQALFTFLKMYFLKKGFLDKKNGFILSVMSSYYSFSKYIKLYYLNRPKRK